MTFQLPQHKVDQHAAAMRDSGVPLAVQKLVARGIANTFEQLVGNIDGLAAAGIVLTPEQTRDLLMAFKDGWRQLEATL